MKTVKQEQIPNEVTKVFVCGGGREVDDKYWKDARELGEFLGSLGNIAYGNGGLSDEHTMMGESYRGYMEAGGKYPVFITRKICTSDLDPVMDELNGAYVVEDINELCSEQRTWGHIVVVMPGGTGTAKEIMNYIEQSYDAPEKGPSTVIIYNKQIEGAGFIDNLLKYFKVNGARGFNDSDVMDKNFVIVDSMDDLKTEVRKAVQKKQDRQLDVFSLVRDPSDLDVVFSMLDNNRDKLTEEEDIQVITGLSSTLKMGRTLVDNHTATMVYAPKADVAVCLSDIPNIDELGDSIDPNLIVDRLIEEGFNYKLYSVGEKATDKDGDKLFSEEEKANVKEKREKYADENAYTDPCAKELWLIRDSITLSDLVNRSDNKTCDFYPDVNAKLSLFYRDENEKPVEIWGQTLKGVLITDNKAAFFVSEKDQRNLGFEDTVKQLQAANFTINLKEGKPEKSEFKDNDLSKQLLLSDTKNQD